MTSGPPLFSDIDKRAKDLLSKDYNVDNKFTLLLGSSGLGLTATGLKMDQIFVGDLNTLCKSGQTTVNVKVDTFSNVSAKVMWNDIMPRTNAGISFRIPDHKSGKLHVQHFHHHASIDSSIGLTPTPTLDISATIGSLGFSVGGEVGFDTASASFTKYNAGISMNRPDLSAAVSLLDKGQAAKISYVHAVSACNWVAGEMTHRFSGLGNSFTFGTSHVLNPLTVVKTRFSDNGKVAMVWQHEWRPQSLVTVSAEFDSKASSSTPKMGFALALKP